MSQEAPAPDRRWPLCLTGGVLAAVLFLAFWLPLHPARPHLPTSDLYTHLSVARHLARGDGFQTDVIYPLSLAFPFARKMPQPLIHRQPGFAVLLTVPYLAAGGDPHRTEEQVRRLQILLLGLVLATGTAVLLRRRNKAAVLPWLVLMFFNPLLVFAVDWGMVELVCSLLLLILWLRTRQHVPERLSWLDGLLAGLVCLLRLDLFWIPLLWWGFSGGCPLRPNLVSWTVMRRLGPVFLVWLVVIAPWAIRNIQLTGQPFFSLQGYAEHVKDTRVWPEYSVYRQLDLQPFFETMWSNPVPVLRKVARGIRFYIRDLDRLVPALVLVGLAWGTLAFFARRFHRAIWFYPGSSPMPIAAICLTTLFLGLQYSFFDHSLRHLLVVLPVMFWEVAAWIGCVVPKALAEPGQPYRFLKKPAAGFALAALVALAAVSLFPCRTPGWNYAAAEAAQLAPRTAQQVDELMDAPDGVLFVDNSAVPWYIDRSVVWAPTRQDTRDRICEFLGQPEAKP
jgi:hypothetical protein